MTLGIRGGGIIGEVDPTEVLDDADLAGRREAEHQAISLIEHAARAAAASTPERGVCLYCRERCLPTTVYCDPDCRDGHEAEQRARSRQGRG